MSYTVLDIGAGSKFFAKALRKRNPKIDMLVLCGEPYWEDIIHYASLRVVSREKTSRLLNKGDTGVYRVKASYEDFKLPENSLDLVTLNCPHPFGGPKKEMVSELERCLKPGGLLFSSHVAFDVGQYPASFELITAGRWKGIKTAIDVSGGPLPESVARVFPQSWNMTHNILAHKNRDPFTKGIDYVYCNGISPFWKLLQKPK